MPTKYVNDTPAGKSISAWVILRRGRLIATVRSIYRDSGGVLVNVFNHGDAESNRSLRNKDGSYRDLAFQSGTAYGYGYDKQTAAMAGLEIDGHKLANHCEGSRPAKPGALYKRDAKPPRGWHFANWTSFKWVRKEGTEDSERVELPASEQGYSDCYKQSGLDYLTALGYQVIRAI